MAFLTEVGAARQGQGLGVGFNGFLQLVHDIFLIAHEVQADIKLLMPSLDPALWDHRVIEGSSVTLGDLVTEAVVAGQTVTIFEYQDVQQPYFFSQKLIWLNKQVKRKRKKVKGNLRIARANNDYDIDKVGHFAVLVKNDQALPYYVFRTPIADRESTGGDMCVASFAESDLARAEEMNRAVERLCTAAATDPKTGKLKKRFNPYPWYKWVERMLGLGLGLFKRRFRNKTKSPR